MRKVWEQCKLYFWNHLVAFDQWINVWLGGDPDETLSSRMGKLVERDKCRMCKYVCRWLNVFEDNHCERSVERDRGRRTVIK